MKYYLIAGEASGDMHAARLMRAILQKDPGAQFRFYGGDRMAEVAGHAPTRHSRDLAFMGFVEIAANLRTILGLLANCKRDVADFAPDALILVDYPGFNIRMAAWAKKQGIRSFYYISPQVWAWRQGRVHKIMRNVEQLYAILPFEQDFYHKNGYAIQYVGHPLLEEVVERHGRRPQALSGKESGAIALLPGSRKQEIKRMAPLMAGLARAFPGECFLLAAAPNIEAEMLAPFFADCPNVAIRQGETYAILAEAKAAVVTSGTATLEAALFQLPQVVVYKANPVSYRLARKLVDVEYVSLVNLILKAPVVSECLQAECTVERVGDELRKVLPGGPKREAMLSAYQSLWERIDEGGASGLVAEDVVRRLFFSA